jgi:predicted nucleic acid-binding protein
LAEPQTVVLDTSVVLKWFLGDEEHCAEAIALRDAIAAGQLRPLVPSHLPLELAAGLVSAMRRGRLPAEDVSLAVGVFRRLDIAVLSVDSVLAQVASLASQLGVSAYDAAFLLSAEISGAPLVTADEALLQKAASAGHQVMALSDYASQGS